VDLSVRILTGDEESPPLSLASEIFASLIARWLSRFDSLPREAEFEGRVSIVADDDPLPWVMALELEPVDDELVWLLEELGVLNEDAPLWLLKLELLDGELVELGAGLLCVVLNEDEDEELDELLDEAGAEDEVELLLPVVECCAKSAVETSVRLTTIRINRRMTIPPAT